MITKTGNWYDQSMDNSNNEWFYNIYIMSNNCEKLLKQILLLVYKHNNLIFYFVSKLLILRYYQITKKKKKLNGINKKIQISTLLFFIRVKLHLFAKKH